MEIASQIPHKISKYRSKIYKSYPSSTLSHLPNCPTLRSNYAYKFSHCTNLIYLQGSHDIGFSTIPYSSFLSAIFNSMRVVWTLWEPYVTEYSVPIQISLALPLFSSLISILESFDGFDGFLHIIQFFLTTISSSLIQILSVRVLSPDRRCCIRKEVLNILCALQCSQ